MKGVFFPQPGRNVAHHQKIRKGDVGEGFAEADRVFEFRFREPAGAARAAGDPHRDRHRARRRRGRDRHLGAVAVHGALALLPHLRPAAAEGAGARARTSAAASAARRASTSSRSSTACRRRPAGGRSRSSPPARRSSTRCPRARGSTSIDPHRRHRATGASPRSTSRTSGTRAPTPTTASTSGARRPTRAPGPYVVPNCKHRLLRGLHEQDLRHRLPRLRPPRGALGHRAQHGPRRPRAGDRPVRVPPQEPAPRGRDHHHRRARSPRATAAPTSACAWWPRRSAGTRRRAAGGAGRARRAASCAARASPCCTRRPPCRPSPRARRPSSSTATARRTCW